MLILQFTFFRAIGLCRSVNRFIVTHLSPTTSLLRSSSSDNELYLLGTAHVSEASIQEVVDLIRLVKPDVVFLELDTSRAAQLRNRNDPGNGGGTDLSSFDLTKYMERNPLFNGILKKLPNSPLNQSLEKLLPAIPSFIDRLGWLPPQGSEMKAAMLEADRIGARCVYGDIEFSETTNMLKSTALGMMSSPASMMKTISNVPSPPPELKTLFSELIGGQDPQQLIEDIKTRERSKMMTSYLSKCFPLIYDVMITKRDIHMAKQLKTYCSTGKVVAVVGVAHVEGIEREWETLDNVK